MPKKIVYETENEPYIFRVDDEGDLYVTDVSSEDDTKRLVTFDELRDFAKWILDEVEKVPEK